LATTIPEAVTTISAGTLRLLLTSISYRAKARKELRRKPPMVPRRPPRPCCWADPAGLAWSAICRTVWHGFITGAPLHPYIPYYNRAAVLTCAASRRGAGIWYRLSASGCVYALQRGAGGIIAACAGLVSLAVKWVQSQEKPL
jgi:hypothetical protein